VQAGGGELAEAEKAADVDYLLAEIPKAIGQSMDGVTRVATLVQAMKAFAHPDEKEKSATNINEALRNTLTVARNELKYVADVETELNDLPPVVLQHRRSESGVSQPAGECRACNRRRAEKQRQ